MTLIAATDRLICDTAVPTCVVMNGAATAGGASCTDVAKRPECSNGAWTCPTGTVPMEQCACSDRADAAEFCATDAGAPELLVILNPDISLDGYRRFLPDEKRKDAGDPAYVELRAGMDAVAIAGPDVASASGLFALMNPSIDLIGATASSAAGYAVTVNGHFLYRIAIDDFEYEVTLARVELSEVNQIIQSQFVFAANPTASGVAHSITITATGATALSAADPVTVEVR
jgi:hypothetical protein